MFDLPSWANTPIGRALVAEVLANPPEARTIRHTLPSIYGGYPDGTSTTYVSKPASLLRRLHKEWLQRQYTRLDRQFAITGVWDSAEGRAIHDVEDANALIERLLAEQGAERRAA